MKGNFLLCFLFSSGEKKYIEILMAHLQLSEVIVVVVAAGFSGPMSRQLHWQMILSSSMDNSQDGMGWTSVVPVVRC